MEKTTVNTGKESHKITTGDLLQPLVKKPVWYLISSDSEYMEYGVLNPFGKLTVKEISIKAKAESGDGR